MSTQRVAIVIDQGASFTFSVTERPVPTLNDNEVLVRLTASGICGTDISLGEGKHGPCKDILGHEGVGKVEQIGKAVDPTSIQIGQLVGVGWIRDSCGQCETCSHPDGETRCRLQQRSGWQVDGTLAEYVVVPSRYVVLLPDGVPHEHLAPIMCAGVTIYRALKASGAIAGSFVAISGAGGLLGTLGIQYARAMGLRIVAIDVGDTKRKLCLDAGAEAFIDCASSSDMDAAIRDVTENRKASAVIVCAGSVAAYESAFDLAAPFGTIVCVGILPPGQKIGFSPTHLIDGGFRVIGSLVGSRKEVGEAADFVRRGLVKPEVRVVGFGELAAALADIRQGREARKVVLKMEA
ncbi:hypothetical protein NLU13_6735 [Sarocladium strictum]|uniref:alcohol dehydrogenase n=1 Tax=Sarocladium strictum TaxID=5046 RepID=A0AA39GEH5_SARSR|nr:hypothetical protein NLU13_6735 [Sarocladium strictum]